MNHRYAGRKPLVAIAMLLAMLAGCRSTSFQQILDRQTEILDRLDEIERSVRFASATVKEQERASQLRWEEFVQSLGQPIDRASSPGMAASTQGRDPFFVRSEAELSNNATLVDLLKSELSASMQITQSAITSGADTVKDLNAKRIDLLKALDENTAEIEKKQIELAQAIAGWKAGLAGKKLEGDQALRLKLAEFAQDHNRQRQVPSDQAGPPPDPARPNG